MSGALRDFLMTGTLGGVALGWDTASVRHRLGAPELEGPTNPGFLLWKYGAAEITFYDDRVYALGLYLGRRSDLPPVLALDGYLPGPSTTADDLVEYARRVGIRCSENVHRARRYPDTRLLVFGIGVTAYCYRDPPKPHLFDHFCFNGFQYPPERLHVLIEPQPAPFDGRG